MKARCFMLAIVVALGLAAAPTVHAQNLLPNGGFKIPHPDAPAGASTALTGQSVGGMAAITQWSVWNNTPATTTTQLVPSAPPGSGASMLHVKTTGAFNGLVNLFRPWSSSAGSPPSSLCPAHTSAAVWVYVVSGQVLIGTGLDGNVRADAVSSTTGKWELLQAPNGVSPANEFIIYSASVGAEFYVYNPQVTLPGQDASSGDN